MSRRYTYATGLSWGDFPTAELEVEVSYSVDWGSPESGFYGPPEDYDPGSPAIVEDIRVEKIDGLPVAEWEAQSTEYAPGHTVASIIDKLEMDHEADMIAEATEAEVAAYDDYQESLWEERRLGARR